MSGLDEQIVVSLSWYCSRCGSDYGVVVQDRGYCFRCKQGESRRHK